MGLMAHEAAHVDVRRYRRPWYWLVVLFLVAVTATFLVMANAHSRIEQNDSQFATGQLLRMQTVEQRIDEYFGTATQLASAGAAMLRDPHGDRRLTQRLVLALYESRRNVNVYGLGAFYAPYAFDPHVRLVSFYDRSNAPLPPGAGSLDPGKYDHVLPGNVDEVAYESAGDKDPVAYTGMTWYKLAAASPGDIVFHGPFTDSKRSFISTMMAMGKPGKVVGVVSVDILTVAFQSLMQTPLVRGDVAWIVSGRKHIWLVGTSAHRERRGELYRNRG